jgi:hypothetical protein
MIERQLYDMHQRAIKRGKKQRMLAEMDGGSDLDDDSEIRRDLAMMD